MENLKDEEVADFVIARLNAMLKRPAVRNDVLRLIETRIKCSSVTADHETIQVGITAEGPTLGFLGLLNGIVGKISGGKYDSWGHVAAVLDDDGVLVGFKRTGTE